MKKKYIGKILIAFTVLIFVCGYFYVNDYYHTNEAEVEAFETEHEIKVEVLGDNNIVCVPDEPKAGMIFYPGGKVEYTAYLPLMKECASNGILSVLVEMPWNLAVLDINAAEGIAETYPEITTWYLAGHSLGGTMAASYLVKNADKYEGLILLGSYTTAELNKTDLKVLSIYGSEDYVMNKENYIENIINLPIDFEEKILEGGNHAGFGMYGSQEGDGLSTISNSEQIRLTADIIREFILK